MEKRRTLSEGHVPVKNKIRGMLSPKKLMTQLIAPEEKPEEDVF